MGNLMWKILTWLWLIFCLSLPVLTFLFMWGILIPGLENKEQAAHATVMACGVGFFLSIPTWEE